jgi:hypothetical protein
LPGERVGGGALLFLNDEVVEEKEEWHQERKA